MLILGIRSFYLQLEMEPIVLWPDYRKLLECYPANYLDLRGKVRLLRQTYRLGELQVNYPYITRAGYIVFVEPRQPDELEEHYPLKLFPWFYWLNEKKIPITNTGMAEAIREFDRRTEFDILYRLPQALIPKLQPYFENRK